MAKATNNDDKKKSKLIRDSFTMTRDEHAQLRALKLAAMELGLGVKKSELLRAGVAALAAMSPTQLKTAVASITSLKTGRRGQGLTEEPVTNIAAQVATKTPSTATVSKKAPAKKVTPPKAALRPAAPGTSVKRTTTTRPTTVRKTPVKNTAAQPSTAVKATTTGTPAAKRSVPVGPKLSDKGFSQKN
jgi:hypothetical protein